MKCPDCNEEIFPGSTSCGNCGASLDDEPTSIAPDAKAHAAETIVGTPVPFSLIVLVGLEKDQRIPLEEDETRIGRETDNELVLLDPLISRHHAAITRKGENYELKDLASANGVCVNDVRISTPQVLQEGDRLKLGDTEILFTQASLAPEAFDTGKPTISMRDETPVNPQPAPQMSQEEPPAPPPPPIASGSAQPDMIDEGTSPRPQPPHPPAQRKGTGVGKWVALSCAVIVILLVLLACLAFIVIPQLTQIR
jgi:pSer/pThr/pTyr-binding forkhead associated (FHA) protein